MEGSTTSINPFTGEEIKKHLLHNDSEVEQIISECDSTFNEWRKTSFDTRSKLLVKAAEELEKNKAEYAETMTLEMGKTYQSAMAEVEKCAWVCRYYAENGEAFLADEQIESDASKSMISYQPIGVVLAVMPWNYPMWQVFRFAAPALMGGNVGILKHASNVPQSALNIEQVFHRAGLPSHAFRTLLIKSGQVEKILNNKLVKAATLTGSGPAGSAVASLAGKQIKKTVLELGGSDAYLILEDADIDLAVENCVTSRLLNAGQSCIGAKRFIVVEAVYEEFLAKFSDQMSDATMGNPMHAVDLGPMARYDLRDEVHQQVQDSVAAGAELILGGFIPDSDGAFYPPTILTDVPSGCPAADEEIFGPVASVFKVANEKEAVQLANDHQYGLGACVFTKDLAKGERIAKEELEAGCCFVNQFVKSDPRLPFGGIKNSGYGRELSYLGIREFMNIKTVYVK